MDFLLCLGDALSDETFQEEVIAPAAWRAGGVLSCQQQGEASEKEKTRGMQPGRCPRGAGDACPASVRKFFESQRSPGEIYCSTAGTSEVFS